MTIGDKTREIKKSSLQNEITKLKNEVRAILNNDPDASERDAGIIAYNQLILEKEHALKNL